MFRVCQQLASIVQYLERSFFIISYFGFGFTSAYNSILFCCLWRTHDSARLRLVGLALYTITDDRDCLQRVALGRPIPTVNKNPVAKCDELTMVQQLPIVKRDIRSESRFQPTSPAFDTPVRGSPSEYRHKVQQDVYGSFGLQHTNNNNINNSATTMYPERYSTPCGSPSTYYTGAKTTTLVASSLQTTI